MYINRRTWLKDGVSVRGISNEMLFAIIVVESCYHHLGYDCIITSGVDGEHSWGSEHYKGDAVDFRTRHMQPFHKKELVDMVASSLNEDYDVVLESTHLHVEYDPKLPIN